MCNFIVQCVRRHEQQCGCCSTDGAGELGCGTQTEHGETVFGNTSASMGGIDVMRNASVPCQDTYLALLQAVRSSIMIDSVDTNLLCCPFPGTGQHRSIAT